MKRFRLSERQLLWAIMVGLLVAYLLAFAVVAFRRQLQPPELAKRPVVQWMTGTPSARRAEDLHYQFADNLDPSLMSLPNRHGFSLAMWQRGTGEYRGVFEPQIELAFLATETPTNTPELLVEKPFLKVVLAGMEKLPGEAEPAELGEFTKALNRSVVQVNGGLAARGILKWPELPVVASEAGLKPTRLRIAVGSDGGVRFATIDRSCGIEAVDAQALAAVRQLRFEPAREADSTVLVWGIARFLWAVNGLTAK